LGTHELCALWYKTHSKKERVKVREKACGGDLNALDKASRMAHPILLFSDSRNKSMFRVMLGRRGRSDGGRDALARQKVVLGESAVPRYKHELHLAFVLPVLRNLVRI
jgi:hypothetical protein